MKEFKYFITALTFYTRIPFPEIEYKEEYLAKSARYFPLVGAIVGGIGALTFWLFSFILPGNIAILLSMAATIFITGAFHEDGFADTCDGFGGGWTKERILEIMKDSSLGTYGAIGLMIILFLKYQLLIQFTLPMIPVVMIAGHSISRLAAISFLSFSSYAREADTSKARNLSQHISIPALFVGACFGLSPILLIGIPWCFLAVIPIAIVIFLLNRYFNNKIGGFTGDCLGAVQQLTEITFYLFCVSEPWKYI